MKIAFFLFVLIALTLANTPAGVVEQVYSKNGLDNHYRQIFKRSESTFGDHDMGTEGDVYGYWIFGTGMTIKNTYLDEYDLGDVTQVTFKDNVYDFEHTAITGKLKYTWSYRWFVMPFSHSAECDFSVGVHHIKQKYFLKNETFGIERTVEYTTGEPTIDCTDGDATQSSHWGYEWMIQIREDYKKNLGANLQAALNSWMNGVDSIFNTVKLANVDELSYTLTPHLKEAQSDANSNLVMGINYDISINSKSRSPVPREDISQYQVTGDMTTYFFEEYFQSLLELDKEAIDFWLAVTGKNLPAGLSYGMKVKDFLYIIDGIQKYSSDSDVEADCEYGTGNPVVSIKEGLTASLTLPIACTLKTGKDTILTSSFTLLITAQPQISSQGALSLTNFTYTVNNFLATSNVGKKVLTDYLIRRIESYANAARPLSDLEYFDNRFANMTDFSISTGNKYLQVSGVFA